MKTNYAKLLQYLALLSALFLVSCGGGGGGEGGGGIVGPVITELTWNAAPAAGSVTAGQTVLYKFTYPIDGGLTGDPSAQIAVTLGGNVAAYLCSTSACGPGQPAINTNPSVTTADQVWTVNPGAVTDYYVAIYGTAASNFTIQATGT